MAHHVMKSWPQFFSAIMLGAKTHDLRSMKDRDFKVGDTATLQEFDPVTGEYSGRSLEVEITFITSEQMPCAYSSAVLERGYCILSLHLLDATGAVLPFSPKPKITAEESIINNDLFYNGGDDAIIGADKIVVQKPVFERDLSNGEVREENLHTNPCLPTEEEKQAVEKALKKAGLIE